MNGNAEKDIAAESHRSTEQIRIGPDLFVTGPYVPCPKCGRTTYGILWIDSSSYTRRCKSCLYPIGTQDRAEFPLPSLNKKVIYLDQLVVSDMMKAINPQTKAFREQRVPKIWRQLFERLDSLSKLQLTVCPESSFHHAESSVSEHYAALKKMYEHFSGNVSFHHEDSIKLAQTHRHVTMWLADKNVGSVEIVRTDAIRENVDAWLNRFHISVEMGYAAHWADDLRRDRSRSHEAMIDLFEAWQEAGLKNLANQYRDEINGYGPAVLHRHQERLAKMQEIVEGSRPLTLDDAMPSFVSRIVEYVLAACGRKHSDGHKAAEAAVDYLGSADLSGIPYVHISSLLLAGIARRAASGQKRPPNRGMMNDLNMVSTLLPYCDAMFLDRDMHALLSEKDVSERLGFDTHVFSMRNVTAFLDYLDQLRASAPGHLLQAVEEVYGDSWAKPFVEMYGDTDT